MNNNYRLIIADDHQIVIDGIKSILNDTPYKITAEASDGQQAMDIINASPEKYDLLITDISMPLLSGTELCKMVKHSHPKIKVLVLSMYSSPPMVKEAVLAEADGFLLKNSGKEELITALHKILSDGTYYAEQIIPIIYSQIEKEKIQKENISILTKREQEILSLIVNEYTSEEISHKLSISKKTVDNHRAHILEKTGCLSTVGLVKFALRNGLV